MDYYKVLGIGCDASKSEIKQAFRNLALQYHPDKHSSSPKGVKDGMTLKFKQISEAYDVLSDDRKRADYNFRQRSSQGFNSSSSSYGYGYGYQTHYQNPNSYNFYNNKSSRRRRGKNGREFVEISFRFLTTRAFLLNAAFVGVLLGGAFGIDMGREALWKLKNPGKSFEDAMDSIAKAKPVNDKS